MNFKAILSSITLLTLTMNSAFAGPSQARVIKKVGEVKVYSHPGKKVSGPAPHVLYEGDYYSLGGAKLGQKIKNGNIIATGPNAKAKLIFPNGDQINVGPNTFYKITWKWDGKSKNPKSVINLMRGKIRAVISPKGPRSGLQIKTKSAAMGVRGTDFYISQAGATGKTEVSVMRGEVEVKKEIPQEVKKKMAKAHIKVKPDVVKVKTGEIAEVQSTAQVKPAAARFNQKEIEKVKEIAAQKIKVEKISQKDLVVIQKSSVITKEEVEKEVKENKAEPKVAKTLEKEIEKLEKKAIKNTLEDIKRYDPKLYAQVSKDKTASVENINTQVVKKIFKSAPKERRKPTMDDLEDLDEDAYDKYFQED